MSKFTIEKFHFWRGVSLFCFVSFLLLHFLLCYSYSFVQSFCKKFLVRQLGVVQNNLDRTVLVMHKIFDVLCVTLGTKDKSNW